MKRLSLVLVCCFFVSSMSTMTIAKDLEYQSNFCKGAISQDQLKNLDITPYDSEKDVLISVDNPDRDDINSKIIRKENTLVVTYEKLKIHPSTNNPLKTCPICWSQDYGKTWTAQFELDSAIFDMSGVIQTPDIKYVSGVDQFFFSSIDPVAGQWNNVMFFMDGDIANAEEALGYALSGPPDYYEAAAGATEHWGISVTTENAYDMEKLFGVGYFSYPDFDYPPVMGGYYYDGNSVHDSAPADKLEVAMNEFRILLVSEQIALGKISIKSTVNDEALLTNGEMQHGMDKYADIEQWPGEFIANGTDPDVAGSGQMVYVVYTEEGDVKLSYSSCRLAYEPDFEWHTITIALDAGFPTVYADGYTIKVAYVKHGNLYLVESTDGACSWEEPFQVNDVNGTVVEMPGSVEICDMGVVWTDSRNGPKDIYYQVHDPDYFVPRIINISGGFGIFIDIENPGNAVFEDMEITLGLDAPWIMTAGVMSTNASIGDHESITVRMFVFGFGTLSILVECGDYDSVSALGFIFGPFVWII